MKKQIINFFILFIPIQFVLIYVLKRNPLWVEEYYTNGFFIYVSKFQHALTSWIPFSLGDVSYTALVFIISAWIFKIIKSKFRKFTSRLKEALAFLSLIYFLFHICWGFNYYRLPLHQSLGISTDYTKEDLRQFTCDLIQKTNNLHSKLTQNDSLKVRYDFKQNQLQHWVFEAYKYSDNKDIRMPYRVENLKKSLFSLPLSYGGFSGYVNPFTNEAQYNYKIPTYKLPTTMAHEIGHQLGYSKENEANFIASLVTIQDKNQYLRYSGLTFALKYSLNDMYKKDPLLSEILIAELNSGVIENYKEVQKFWNTYRGPTERIMEMIYGNYLKVNNQPQGIESYDYVVALLVNYCQQKQDIINP